jgi:hypothetical protein
MQRHQRNAPARVRLWTVIAGLTLSLLSFGMSPADAATGSTTADAVAHTAGSGRQVTSTAHADRSAVTTKAVHRTVVPKWVSRPDTTRVDLPGTSNANVDWQWLRGGWEVKFNWAETRQMSRGFSYCTAIAALLPTGITQAVAAACGLLWIIADIGVSRGDCVKIFVPISLINTSVGYWSCSH